MSRISCNVTKDLLPPYLDEICSEESKELVEEHLKECIPCREFLTKLKEQDLGKDAQNVDCMKKVRRFTDAQTVIGVAVLLVILFFEVFGTNFYVSDKRVYYFIEMPILMVAYAFLMGSGQKRGLPKKAEWAVPILGGVIVFAAGFLQYRFLGVLKQIDQLTDARKTQLGPYFYRLAQMIAIAAILFLAVLLVIAQKKRRVFRVSQNLAWFGMYLAMMLGSMLKTMATPEAVAKMIFQNMGVLSAEFLAVTVLSCVLERIRNKAMPEPV